MMVFLALSLIACDPIVSSSYLETMMLDVDGIPTADIKVEIRDREGLLFSEETSDATGALRISLPPHETFFAIVSFDNYRSISYTGFSGDGTFVLPAGTLALREETELENIKEWSSLCDSQIENSLEYDFTDIRVDGNVRLNIAEQAVDSLPTLEDTVLHLIDEDGTEYSACYGVIDTQLNSDEENPDEENPDEENQADNLLYTSTNPEGMFSFGNVPVGRYALHVEKEYEQGYLVSIEQLIYIPENGNVPLYPVLFPLPQ